MEETKNLRNYIDAELCIVQIYMSIIIGKLFGGWVWYISAFIIIGNIYTMFKNVRKLPKDYTK